MCHFGSGKGSSEGGVRKYEEGKEVFVVSCPFAVKFSAISVPNSGLGRSPLSEVEDDVILGIVLGAGAGNDAS